MPTVRIPISNTRKQSSEYARVSIQDWRRLRSVPWSKHRGGYAVTRSLGLMHRNVLNLEPGDRRQADHIDRNRLNNTRTNLRVVTAAQNSQNRASKPGSSSRYRGVGWDKSRNLWVAYVRADGKSKYLGRYADEDEAGRVAREARQLLMPYSIT